MTDPMSPDEFDNYMDGLTIREQNKVLGADVQVHDKPLGNLDEFTSKLKRLVLRLFWIAAWGWQIFTFAWPSALLIKWIERQKEWKGNKNAQQND